MADTKTKFLNLFTRNRPEAMRILDQEHDKQTMVNLQRKDGRTCAHFAAQDGDHRSLQVLINCGANVWKLASGGFFPLHLAVMGKRAKVVKMLLSVEIPYSVLKRVTDAIFAKCEYDHPQCFFRKAYKMKKPDIPRDLVLRFFPLLHEDTILDTVRQLIEFSHSNLSFITDVLKDSEHGMRALRDVNSFLVAVQEEDPETDLISHLLEIGDTGYPLDMKKFHNIVEPYIGNCEECVILKLFIRNRHKILNLHTPELLHYAIKWQNLNAVDILLATEPRLSREESWKRAIGSLLYALKFSCVKDVRCSWINRDKAVAIVHKILQSYRWGSKPLIFKCHPPVTEEKQANLTSYHDVVNRFYKGVTLFDLLEYRLYMCNLRSELLSTPVVGDEGSRKRQREL